MATNPIQRRLTTILAADVAGYSRLAGADEEGTVSRLRALRHELIDPVIAAHNGRTVKLMGDGRLVEFASVVDAVRCALEVQRAMVQRNANIAPEKRIEFRVGIHLGDVIVESDGDLMGDGVNIAARIESIAEPGGMCLSNAAYEQVRDKITASFTDLGDQELKNIARPVRVFALNPSPPLGAERLGEVGDSREFEHSPPHPDPLRPNGAEREKRGGGAPRLSIVVLPFANIGGDPEQEYFVDGVTESLTTDLSRIAGSFVIARNTAFTYKGKAYDVKQIGRELGVRYVLEGSMQRGGNRLRINVQLIDAETGTHLWAERFDKPVGDLFEMQDEIVARLANQLGAQLVEAEARRAERSPHPDSMDLYFQGTACWHKGRSPQILAQARGLFERALALDPSNVDALTGVAWVDFLIAANFSTDGASVGFAAVETVAMKALSLAPNHAFAHFVLGTAHVFTSRAAQGIAECEHALALDRNLAVAHSIIATGKNFTGRVEETEAHILDALRLSPRDVTANSWTFVAAAAKLQSGHDEEAVAWLRRSIDANRNFSHAHFYLAAALALLGRQDEARAAAQEGMALNPTLTVRRFLGHTTGLDPIAVAQRERIIDGMRMAGVPE
jgi:TolB-like protein/class 3 adenylate cyclase